jgi:glycosyltransferase involved in cell wall biosynthesis
MELSILLPCLNEERTVGACVDAAASFLRRNRIHGEVLVADNASTDRSRQIALEHGARVVRIAAQGYGNALRGGIQAARGTFIVMADADGSYDLLHLMPFVKQLRRGHDLVIGNRFLGGIARGAMPWHHRYLGNPVLSWMGRLFFRTPARDFHCGLRGFTKVAAARMNLQSAGMELASEIVIKASLLGMKVCEVPTTLEPDRRDRKPHLRSWRDGWRHLRFLLIFSPRWLFAYPGALLLIVGAIVSLVLFFGPVNVGVRLIDFHSFIASGTLMILGMNMLGFSAITRVYAFYSGLLPSQPGFFRALKYLNLEKGLALGFACLIIGLALGLRAVGLSSEFSVIGFNQSVRLVFGGSLAILLGGEIILTSFVLSILGIPIHRSTE